MSTKSQVERAYVVSRLDPSLRLTAHAVSILVLLSQGHKARQVATLLGVAPDTVYKEVRVLSTAGRP